MAAEALAFARLIDPAHWRTSAVADVAADIALVDEAAGADLARQIVSVDARVSAMLQVADVCESWNPALSEDLRQDARRTPTEMTEGAERATALVSAALAVVAGDRNLAIDLARQAEAIVVRPVVAAHDARPDTPGHNSQYTAQYVASRIGGLDIDDGLAACAGLDEFNAERAIAEMVERWASVDPRRALALVERLRAGGGEAVLFDIPLGLAKATRADMAVTVALAIPDADLDAADKIALLRRALELAHPSWQASLRISGILLGVAPSPGLATAILKSAEW